jgi:hypothetical protein
LLNVAGQARGTVRREARHITSISRCKAATFSSVFTSGVATRLSSASDTINESTHPKHTETSWAARRHGQGKRRVWHLGNLPIPQTLTRPSPLPHATASRKSNTLNQQFIVHPHLSSPKHYCRPTSSAVTPGPNADEAADPAASPE